MTMRNNINQWLLSRKFFLLIAYWCFIFIGAFVMYWADCEGFEDVSKLYNDALEWALYGYLGFAGIEGSKEIIDMVKGKRGASISAPTTVSDMA
jgi:hypothetical protein